MNVKLFIAIMLSGLASLLSVSFVNGQDPLADFLIENRLNRLLLTHREVQADRGLPDRNTAMEQLQQSYARELFRQVDDSPWTQKVWAKAKSYLALNPNRKSERLRLAVSHREVELLQRQHLMGERVAKADVDRIIEEINLLQRGVKQQVNNLDRLTELQQTELGDQDLLNQLRQQFGHGEYLLGWGHFLKSAASDQHSKPVLRDAESYFRSFLGLDPHANLIKFSAGQFGHQSRFQKMATVGLAAMMHGIGAGKQADHCFKIAEENASRGLNAESEIETINQWKFAVYLDGNRTQAAQMFDEKPELLRSKMLIGAILKQSDTADELVEKALTGLALNLDSDQLREALAAFPDALSHNEFLGPWIRGYLSLDDFQQDGEEASLKQATRELNEAANKLGPQVPAELRGHCRFLLGSCLHLNKNYPDAAHEFLRASELLRSAETFGDDDRDLAAESAYRALQSVRLLPGDQEDSKKRIATWLTANFGASPFARLTNFDADLDRRDGLSDREAVAYLSSLRKSESSSLIRSAASVELARRFHLSPNLPVDQFRNYLKTIQKDGRVSADAQIQTNFYFLSKLLAQPNPADFSAEIDDVLVNVKGLIEGAAATNMKTTGAAKFLYYQSLALRTLRPENYSRAHDYFQQLELVNHSSPWTSAAMTEIAKVFENAEDEMNVNDQAFRGRMIKVYEFLSKLTKSTKSANSEIVSLKLARLYIADERLLEAEELVLNSKQDILWLPLRADLAEKKNDLHQSASLWQQVEKQSPVGTETWLDARWKRLLVLHQIDEPGAIELLNRTIALNPSMPPTYATRFQQLADRWGTR